MKLKTQNSKLKNKRGFTLLFSVLVSVLILAVGASIISIALKQVILSGAGRESQFAFYAANTGLECALYWDLHPKEDEGSLSYVFPAVLGGSGGPDQTEWTGEDELITCGGGQIKNGSGFIGDPFTESGYSWDTNLYTFRMAITNAIPDTENILYCVEVQVAKEYNQVSERVVTTITSKGLNTCDPEDNPRAVERGLVLRYES